MSTTRPSAVEISLAALALVREQLEEEGKRLFAAGAKAKGYKKADIDTVGKKK